MIQNYVLFILQCQVEITKYHKQRKNINCITYLVIVIMVIMIYYAMYWVTPMDVMQYYQTVITFLAEYHSICPPYTCIL